MSRFLQILFADWKHKFSKLGKQMWPGLVDFELNFYLQAGASVKETKDSKSKDSEKEEARRTLSDQLYFKGKKSDQIQWDFCHQI